MGAFLTNNVPFNEGGGLTSVLVPKRLTKAGIGGMFALSGAASIGKEMFIASNIRKMGPVSYTGGPARMTDSFDSGAIQAIKQATKDPNVQQDMLRKILKSSNDGIIKNLEEYGVDGQFLSAFYGMG